MQEVWGLPHFSRLSIGEKMRNDKGQFVAGVRSSPATEFKKGQKVWNKDLKGLHLHPETEFKKGQTAGEKAFNWKGGVQVIANDCVYVRTGINQRVRRPKMIYEKFNGKIKEGYVIFHEDGDKHNDDPSNLTAITRAMLLKKNLKRKE